MSKPSSGLFHGTVGTRNTRLIPGEEGKVTGGNSTTLGKNLLSSMGVSRKIKWTNYQAQHIIPKELSDHPVIQKIGMNMDHHSNGIFLRAPSNDVSALTRHRGYHAPYNEFVKHMLDQIDLNQSTYQIQREVRTLQANLRKMQMSGVSIYPKHGATFDSISRAYKRISNIRR